MNKTLEKGKTLLVDGPASLTLKSGLTEVFAAPIRAGKKIVVRDGKRLPFFAKETASFELSLGHGASTKIVQDNTIPDSWNQAYKTLKQINQQQTIALVLGGVDSGKTSLCTYLTNRLVSEGFSVAILDEDLGQSDIGPPCTVAYATVITPVTDLFNIKAHSMIFIGATSPYGETERTIQAAAELKAEIESEAKANYVIINTDGWAAGQEAIDFKSRLVKVLQPQLVFCLQGDVTQLYCQAFEQALKDFRQERVESPKAIKDRNFEKRQELRKSSYAQYFLNSQIKVININCVAVEGIEASVLFRGHQAENLLVGLVDDKKKVLGLGVIRGVDIIRRSIKVLTSVEQRPAIVVFGKTRLDQNLYEISADAISD